jgi:hypothetical protein
MPTRRRRPRRRRSTRREPGRTIARGRRARGRRARGPRRRSRRNTWVARRGGGKFERVRRGRGTVRPRRPGGKIPPLVRLQSAYRRRDAPSYLAVLEEEGVGPLDTDLSKASAVSGAIARRMHWEDERERRATKEPAHPIRPCRYGEECWSKDRSHHRAFGHPPADPGAFADVMHHWQEDAVQGSQVMHQGRPIFSHPSDPVFSRRFGDLVTRGLQERPATEADPDRGRPGAAQD